ncbi:MAG: 3-hydroxyacyl-CoA dehydrogenase [Proteobacteria bacterium]|nr:3-hydroxyacyl-CoA dehydrogenase [Pseudomonadota bacterium]
MAEPILKDGFTVGVVGTGSMGRGIAQIAAAGGFPVLLFDTRPGATDDAVTFVASMLGRAAEKGQLSADAAKAAIARLTPVESLSAFKACDLVIEAIVEELSAKREMFKGLEVDVAPDAILASNTSSLSVTAMAAACKHPERVAGYHFFNPVPLLRLVEVVEGTLTEPRALDVLDAVARRCGHTPVRCKDTPGFLVNHAGRAFGTESLRILHEGITDPPTIDRVLRMVAGFRMGPFELMDLTGVDVSGPVMRSIYDQYFQEPRYRASPLLQQRIDAGLIGRKAGRGFYDYPDGKQVAPDEPPAPRTRPAAVWLSQAEPRGHDIADKLLGALGARLEGGARPPADALCIVTPIGLDATNTAVAEGLDPTRTVALETLFDPSRRRVLMTTSVTTPAMRDAAHGLLAADGVPVSVIHDSPGFIAQRVVAMIVNLGCDIAQQRVAAPADIDLAVPLGLNYPFGPLAWGDKLGAGTILTILERLHAFYGDPRYRPSPWLKRRALLGVSLLTPEA